MAPTYPFFHLWSIIVGLLHSPALIILFLSFLFMKQPMLIVVNIYEVRRLLRLGVRVDIWHRYLWLHWIILFSQIIIDVDVLLFILCPISVSISILHRLILILLIFVESRNWTLPFLFSFSTNTFAFSHQVILITLLFLFFLKRKHEDVSISNQIVVFR
jgi:hypothetical protein